MNTVWLRENPPRKNPYFRLPDARFLPISHPAATAKIEPTYITIKQTFGELAKMDDETQASFLMRLISHSTFEPGFQNMADAMGVKFGSAVQRRFKALVEKNGFELEGKSHIAVKPFDPQKGVVNNGRKGKGKDSAVKGPAKTVGETAADKDTTTTANKGNTKATVANAGSSKAKAPREGTAKAKKPKCKATSTPRDKTTHKVIKKRKIIKKKPKDGEKATAAPKIVGPEKTNPAVDPPAVQPTKTNPKAATAEEVSAVEMGGGGVVDVGAEILQPEY